MKYLPNNGIFTISTDSTGAGFLPSTVVKDIFSQHIEKGRENNVAGTCPPPKTKESNGYTFFYDHGSGELLVP